MATSQTDTPDSLEIPGDRFGYLPCLDGLRAVSILLVLGFHRMGVVSNTVSSVFTGWAGVDIFFVVSGFLITSLLAQEQKDCGSFSFSHFYVRRSLRIFPAFYLFLFVCWLTGLTSSAAIAIGGVYLTNLDLAFGWGMTTANTTHLWSLAIEEQFYLVWPMLLYLSGRHALPVACGIVVAVWAWRGFLLFRGADWLRITAGFDTRLDCPMIGCAAALIWADPRLRERVRSGLTGSWIPALVAVGLFSIMQTLGHPSDAPFQSRFLLWAFRLPLFTILSATFILTTVINPTNGVTRFLEHPLLVLIGKLSYSLYLWHSTAFLCWDRVVKQFPYRVVRSPISQEIMRLCLSFLFAAMSYYLIERPILGIKKRWEVARMAKAMSDKPISIPTRIAA